MISLSTAVSARAGILVKDRLALERMRTIDAVLFDKTGTLTRGAHVVTAVAAAAPASEDDVLRIRRRRVRQRAPARPGHRRRRPRARRDRAAGFRSLTGRGVEATIDGEAYAVGGPAPARAGRQGARRPRTDDRPGAGGAPRSCTWCAATR